MSKKKKTGYHNYKPRVKRDRTPILSILTPIIIGLLLRLYVILGIISAIILLFYLTHKLNKRRGRYKTKILAVILSYLIAIGFTVRGVYLCYNKIDVISNKIDEITEGVSKVISIGQGKKGNIELQPNELGIMQEVLNNMTTTTGQAQ